MEEERIYPVGIQNFEKLRTKCGISFSTESRTIENWIIEEEK